MSVVIQMAQALHFRFAIAVLSPSCQCMLMDKWHNCISSTAVCPMPTSAHTWEQQDPLVLLDQAKTSLQGQKGGLSLLHVPACIVAGACIVSRTKICENQGINSTMCSEISPCVGDS